MQSRSYAVFSTAAVAGAMSGASSVTMRVMGYNGALAGQLGSWLLRRSAYPACMLALGTLVSAQSLSIKRLPPYPTPLVAVPYPLILGSAFLVAGGVYWYAAPFPSFLPC